MRKEVFANMDLSILPMIATLLFIAVFVGVCIWVFRRGSTEIYHKASTDLLEDDNNEMLTQK